MRTIEAIGRTVDDAIAKGLAELGVTRDEAEITVLDEGSKGVFGFLGVKLARVQISVASLDEPEAPAEPDEEPQQPYAAPAPTARSVPAAPTERSDHPAAQFLYEVARLMNLPEPSIDVTQDEESGTVRVAVDGPSVGPFIGHH
ncbi:MAG: Jag N-terminal domain-containing protein, partial [Eubacteriales bacterium]|nr:Jag N-terminal domain-containing protein [Eubacteriales bacterium]